MDIELTTPAVTRIAQIVGQAANTGRRLSVKEAGRSGRECVMELGDGAE